MRPTCSSALTLLVLTTLSLLLALPVLADEVAGAGAGEAIVAVPSKPKGPVLPPWAGAPDRELNFDWAQIASGEWIKGEIKRMHDEDLIFDSDEFGDVTLSWGDVTSLVSKGVVSVRLLPDSDTLTGRIEMHDAIAEIHTDTGVVEVPRDRINALIVGTLTEKNYWSGSASLGLTGRAGNTQQMDLTARASIVRQTVLTRWRTNYIGEYSTVNSQSTANSHRVPSQFDIFLTPRLFLTTPAVEYFTDEFQNIDMRITAGLGIGYEVIDNSWFFWEVQGGVAYQYTGYDSVVAPSSDTANDASMVLGTTFNFDLPKGIEWDNFYKVQIVVTDIDKTNHHAESILSFDIWGPLDFEISFIFDRIESPRANAAGITPESNDYRYTLGLGLDF